VEILWKQSGYSLIKYDDIAIEAFIGYGEYLWKSILHPNEHSYFYVLILVSLIAWGLEMLLPWRKQQGFIRKDFWMDGFYMFFNFFLFSLVFYNALSEVGIALFSDLLALVGITNLIAVTINSWPPWIQYVFLFVFVDFVQWSVHRLLHKFPFLWEFHKVHHSVKEMGFAAHLRFHWMENIFYKSVVFVAVSMIGFSVKEFFYVHLIAISIGHLNHSNLKWSYGPLKYVFNNPIMHLWHHAKVLPQERRTGVNFGISLSVWDYLFGTAHVPETKAEMELGFSKEEDFPKGFWGQLVYPFFKGKGD
jgi:sterol desaturase/sphingolipid hydroxylase (fatty acid hydroxylase superfamily)